MYLFGSHLSTFLLIWLRLSFCRSGVVLDLGDVEPTIIISNERVHVLADVHLFSFHYFRKFLYVECFNFIMIFFILFLMRPGYRRALEVDQQKDSVWTQGLP